MKWVGDYRRGEIMKVNERVFTNVIEQRSKNMSMICEKDTKIKVALRKAIYAKEWVKSGKSALYYILNF